MRKNKRERERVWVRKKKHPIEYEPVLLEDVEYELVYPYANDDNAFFLLERDVVCYLFLLFDDEKNYYYFRKNVLVDFVAVDVVDFFDVY